MIHTLEKKQLIETIPEGSDLLDQDFKLVFKNTFKELKENSPKELKESMTMKVTK